jgi:hypothetical protein
MLFVPYSSTIDVIVVRSPVKIEATTTTTVTPTTIPNTVNTLRNLFERMAFIASITVSVGNMDGTRI